MYILGLDTSCQHQWGCFIQSVLGSLCLVYRGAINIFFLVTYISSLVDLGSQDQVCLYGRYGKVENGPVPS